MYGCVWMTVTLVIVHGSSVIVADWEPTAQPVEQLLQLRQTCADGHACIPPVSPLEWTQDQTW